MRRIGKLKPRLIKTKFLNKGIVVKRCKLSRFFSNLYTETAIFSLQFFTLCLHQLKQP